MVLISVIQTEGSAPRAAGTWMAVSAHEIVGTIGGGHLEFEALALARAKLNDAHFFLEKNFVLGPALGQCCGGSMTLRFERIDAAHLSSLQDHAIKQHAPVALFGGGHVGHAIVQALAPLPFQVTWIDSRDQVFPSDTPTHVLCEHSNPPQAAVASIAFQSHVLIMSFSHAEDLDILMACLSRQREKNDLGLIGLIGSKTKWALFQHRLSARGFTPQELAQVTCPIGIAGITGKAPAIIAASVAAQLLQLHASQRPSL